MTTNHRYNEMKYRILKLLFNAGKHLSPEEIAKELGAELKTIKSHLTRLHKFSYIWRRIEERANKKNNFCYRYLKPAGLKTFFQLDERVKIRTITGIFVPLNLSKPIPEQALLKYHEAIM